MTGVPRISVLMPVRNGGAWFALALDSILAQENADFEVIVVDDGSTDDTPRVLAECTDPRLRVIRTDGIGIGAALARATQAARGEFLARMDADDVALPGRLAAQAAVLDRDSGCVLVHGAARLIDAAGRDIGRLAAQQASTDERRAILLGEQAGLPIIHPTVMIRASALDAVGGYRPLPVAQDHELWLRLIERGGFTAMPGDVLLYRRHDEAMTRRRMADQLRTHLVSCVCARHRMRSGTDLYAANRPVYDALVDEAERRLSGLIPAIAAARGLRMALREGALRTAAGSAVRLLASGKPGLLLARKTDREILALQHELTAWLERTA